MSPERLIRSVVRQFRNSPDGAANHRQTVTTDRLTHPVLFVALVVLAGCGSLGGGSSTVADTVTPVPVPTDGEAYSAGISAERVSPDILVETHEQQMATTNYTFVSQQRVVGPNGTMWVTNRTRWVANGEESYAGRIDHRVVEFPLGRFSKPIEYWGNDSVYASRRILSDRSEFYGWQRTADSPRNLTSFPLMERSLEATRLSVVERPEGVAVVGSELRSPDRLPSPPYLTDLRNVSVTVSVSDGGVVTRWRLAYDAALVNETVRVTREARLTDVGETTVRRPDWVDTARAQFEASQDS